IGTETATAYKNFVGGERVDAVEGATMDVINPATGEKIAEVPRGTEADVQRAVEAANNALPEWLNSGKPWAVAVDEPGLAADCLRFFAGAARVLEGKSTGEYMKGYTSMIRREPLGVVAGITPWNYPLMMAIWKIGPALAAGNVQIIKPSEQTPLSTLRLMELLEDVV